MCVLTALPTSHSPYSKSYNTEISQSVILQWSPKCSCGRKCCISLTLYQKLEMIQISEEGEIQDRQNAFFFVKQLSCNAKGKFLKETESIIPTNTGVTGQWNSMIANKERVAVFKKNQSSQRHSLKLKHNPE